MMMMMMTFGTWQLMSVYLLNRESRRRQQVVPKHRHVYQTARRHTAAFVVMAVNLVVP
jgi:hypothetical protein